MTPVSPQIVALGDLTLNPGAKDSEAVAVAPFGTSITPACPHGLRTILLPPDVIAS